MEINRSMEVNPSHNFQSALYPEKESWWKFRTRFEKCLLFFIIIFSVLCLALVCIVISYRYYYNSKGKNVDCDVNVGSYVDKTSLLSSASNTTTKVCLTPGCVKAAADILNLIDENVSPCDDFYKFACGGWIQSTTIPDETGHMSIFEQSREKLEIKLKDLVETSNETMPAIVTMRNMYQSCMNLSAIESYGIKPLGEALKSLGGWPVVVGSEWDNTTFDWINVTDRMRKIGFRSDMFIQFKVIADVLNNTKNILFMDEALLGLRRQIIVLGANSTTVRVYHQLMVNTALLLGANNRTQVEKEMWEVIELERQIAQVKHDQSMGEKRQSWYLRLASFVEVANHSQVLANNQTRLGYDWIRFVNAVLQLNDSVTASELVMVDNLDYMGHIDYIITYVNQYDKRLLANFILWRVALQSLSTGSKQMRDMRDNLHLHLYGITEEIARWKVCLSQLTGSLSMALSSLYVKHYFNNASKTTAVNMVNYIRAEFDDILHKINWMDDETKRNAYRKSQMMKAIVGYPEQLINDTLVNQHYKTLSLNNDNFDENIRTLRKWARNREFFTLRLSNDPHNWKNFAYAANVNAFYWSQANSIVIPAGILRDVFFDHDRPQYLNFGTIGYIIGHEITHGFDNVGAQFDEIGNARNWWQNATRDEYNNKAKCIVQQYNDFELKDGHKINGDFTLKENIADNGAIKEAFRAYVKYANRFGEEPLLPGLGYTQRQLFWISAAMNWCSKSTPEMFKTKLDTDTHSPSQARVNVAMSNFKEFAQSFHCPPESKMNPRKRCTVW